MKMGMIRIVDIRHAENGPLSDPRKMAVSLGGLHGIGMVG
jgi:hypothetical protein